MTTDQQPAQGSTADYCSARPGEPHALYIHVKTNALVSVRRCRPCGWIDFDDLREQALALIEDGRRQRTAEIDVLTRNAYEDGKGDGRADGRRQATEGWDREWGVRSPSGGVEVRQSELRARRLASFHEGAQPVSRLVGPWELARELGIEATDA